VAAITMISGVEPLSDPDEAVICGLPRSTALTSPELFTDANFMSEELQITEGVMSAVLPSLNVPLAANCWFFPTDIVVFAGVTAIDVKSGNGFVEDCEPPQPLNAKTQPQSAIETTNLFHSERFLVVNQIAERSRTNDAVQALPKDVNGSSSASTNVRIALKNMQRKGKSML
jgi:hypothetical protein